MGTEKKLPEETCLGNRATGRDGEGAAAKMWCEDGTSLPSAAVQTLSRRNCLVSFPALHSLFTQGHGLSGRVFFLLA